MTAGASCPRCRQLLDEVPATGICPHCGVPLARPGAEPEATQDSSAREIDEKIETGDAWDAPTLAPGVPNADVASAADQATLPPEGQIGEAPSVGAKVRYFGDYELLQEIARGGMGVVYKARQVSLDRVVALKMILAGQLASEKDLQRFHTEAEAAAKLDHPGIVPVHEVGEHEGQHFFSMGYVEGQSLADKLVDGPLPPREAAELTEKLAEAVAYAHEERVIHRDLKPANVLLDKSGQPRITDFGLAKKLEADSHLTGTGQILGTPSYMPPEQAAGATAEVGPATDVYALGAVLYALISGRPPFQAASPMDTLRQVMEKEPVPVRQLDAAIPRDLETISLKCLEKSPERRYASAQELRDELGRFLDDEPIRARPISQTVRVLRWCSRRPAIAATSSLLLLSLILGAGLVTWQWRRAEIARDRAQRALGVARSEQKKADLARHKAQLLSASLAADKGIRHCQEGDIGAGMLWLARGLMNIPSDAVDLEYDLRANLGGWYRSLHRLRGLLEHDGQVSCVVFSPDGTLVLTGSRDGSCRLWKVKSGAPVGSPLKHASSVSDVAFSPDGKLFVTATDSGIVRVWDASNGEEARPPIHVGTAAPKIAISARGRLLTVGPGGEFRLWDIESGTPVGEPGKAHVAITAVACHPTRDQFVTVGDEIQLRFWETSTASPLGDPVQTSGAIAIAFSPDGSRFATGHTASFSARVWDTASRRPVPIPDGAKRQTVSGAFQHKSWVVSVAFSPDGARLLTGSRDGTSRLWNVRTGQPIGPPLQHGTAVRDVAFNADGQTVATVSQDSFARLWELGPGSRPAITMRQPGAIRAVAFSPDGQTVLAGGKGSIVRRWNAANGKPAGPALFHDGPVRDVAFCPDGKKFLTSDYDTIRLWDATTHRPIGDPIHSKPIHRVIFSHDGTRILAGTGEGEPCEALLWDVTSRQRIPLALKHKYRVNGVAIGPADRLALTVSEDSTARVWDLSTGQPVTPPLQHQNALHAAAFSPDGRVVLTGDWNGLAKMWNAETGEPFGPIFRHDEPGSGIKAILAGTFTPDGRMALTCSWDGTLRLWSVTSGKPIGPPLVHVGPVYDVDMSPNGQTAATGGWGSACLWQLPFAIPGSAEAVECWMQLVANEKLDANGEVRILNGADWRERHEWLQRLGSAGLLEYDPLEKGDTHADVAETGDETESPAHLQVGPARADAGEREEALAPLPPDANTAAETVRRDLTLKKDQVLSSPLIVAEDGITIEGNGAIIRGPGKPGDKVSLRGSGVVIEGHSDVTIRNLRVAGFEIGIEATDCRGLTIEGSDFSDNYHDPEHGWGDGERNGGIILTRVHRSVFRRNAANRVWNGIDLYESDDNLIDGNDFSHCSNVCLKLWNASRNIVRDNDLSWGLRIKPGEVHARDSTCVLIESGSDDNRFERNDVTHGGDGIFIRPLNGWLSTGNVFVENDCSYANNNGFESWSPGNTFLRNTANHCSYGFWLGGSDRTTLIGNEAGWNGLLDGKHNAPEPDFRHGGIVIVNGSGSHTVIEDNWCHDNNGGGIVFRGDLSTRGGRWKMYHLVVQGNRLENNQWGVFGRFTDRLFLAGNRFSGNAEDEHFEEVTHLARGDGEGNTAPAVSIEGPTRLCVGQPATFKSLVQVGEPEAMRYSWDVAGEEYKGPDADHLFSAPGFYRVSLTIDDGHLAGLASLDVYVTKEGDELGTENDADRWTGTMGNDPQAAGKVHFVDDTKAIAGKSSVRMRPDPYLGAEVTANLSAGREAPWDLSQRKTLSFWLSWRNPNNGFQGPTLVRLHGPEDVLTYMPTSDGRPVNLLRDLPYPEARSGWLRVELPLSGGDGWIRSEGTEGEVAPHFSGTLRFVTVTTPMETQDATSIASDGEALYVASLEGDRLWRSEDARTWEALRSPREDLGSRGDWINGMLSYHPRTGNEGSLILRHLDPQRDSFGHQWARLIGYDLQKQRWSWWPTRLPAGHGSVIVGDHLFAINHAMKGNYGGPIHRVDLRKPDDQAERTTLKGIEGPNSDWFSRAAQLAEVGGRVFGIKNDWKTPQPATEGAIGDRLFVFDPEAFQPSSYRGGEPWDSANWKAAYTPVEDLGPLPFEVGHGASLVGLPPDWSNQIGAAGGLFIVAGCSPSNHEGRGTPSLSFALYDVESGTFEQGTLPDVTGSGTSAVFHDDKVYIKRGGLNLPSFNSQLWLVTPVTASEAEKGREQRQRSPMSLRAVESLSLQFDSNGNLPFEIWIDGLRFE